MLEGNYSEQTLVEVYNLKRARNRTKIESKQNNRHNRNLRESMFSDLIRCFYRANKPGTKITSGIGLLSVEPTPGDSQYYVVTYDGEKFELEAAIYRPVGILSTIFDYYHADRLHESVGLIIIGNTVKPLTFECGSLRVAEWPVYSRVI